MISGFGLTKKFGDFTAIDKVSFKFDEGIIGLVGQNGAGKSTLFRMISDVLSFDDGMIIIDGMRHNEVEAKRSLFFLPDDPYVDKNDTIDDMLQFYSNFIDIDTAKFYSFIEKFELDRKRRLNNFSKGMRRQAFIALALSTRCKYLLLDEAFDGLDPIIIESLKSELFAAKEEGKTIVISSHNIAQLERMVDRFVILSAGSLSEGESDSVSFVKFQAYFTEDVTKEMLESKGIKVVTFQKYGSITNFAVIEEDVLEEKLSAYNSILLERIPISGEELITLRMIFLKGAK
ncbi:MAG: ABC transporter ATP-binding protein [Paludibacteraceae bacterium]|nr:ABC transporter ATP-binding protein [Paludibacteraceae bacterium]